MRGTLAPIILCLTLAAVSGCGQKGALYLPDEAAEEVPEEAPGESPEDKEQQEENGESEES